MSNSFEQTNSLDTDIARMENDPAWEALVQKKSLEYLQTADQEYFSNEFTGELDEAGYLIKKDGTSSNAKPFQNIGGGAALEQVIAAAKEEEELQANYSQ